MWQSEGDRNKESEIGRWERYRVCVCVRERERERVCMYVCERERVYVWVSERMINVDKEVLHKS